MTSLTQEFASFAATSTVPRDARDDAARAIAEVAAAAASGAGAVTAIAEVAAALGTPPEAGVPGRRERYAASWAALLTAAAAAHQPAGYATVIVPAGLATGAARGLRLDAVADAVAIGLEVAGRLGTMFADHLGAFDPVATIGRLAAAATAGRLLGLSATAAAHAYGIAATQAAGLAAVSGEPIGALQYGKAAADAVQAAWLALDGFTASPAGIEGRRGFAALLASGALLAPGALDAPSTPSGATTWNHDYFDAPIPGVG